MQSSMEDSSTSSGICEVGEDRADDIVILPDDASSGMSFSNARNAPDVAFGVSSPGSIDSLLAQKMASLSMADREKVYYDIHGVSSNIPETPEFRSKCCSAFWFELGRLSAVQLEAYEKARASDPSYSDNEDFVVSFLRADLWDPKQAAIRYARHWEAKLDLFGVDLLTEDITQDHLDQETLDTLYAGYVQFLPLRDQNGRLVHVSFYQPSHISLDTKLKRAFYTSMVTNEDEETQRRGRVAIAYLAGQIGENEPLPRNDWQLTKLLGALPVRLEAVHLCHDSRTLWTPIFAVFKVVASWFIRYRIREHFGSHTEILFKLQTFGIPIHQCFPWMAEKETILTGEHVAFWENRRRLERFRKQEKQSRLLKTQQGSQETSKRQPATISLIASLEALGKSDSVLANPPATWVQTNTACPPAKSSTKGSTIGFPGMNDVLLGRGKGFYQHTGNIRFRHWIESRSEAYDRCETAYKKKEMTKEIIRLVKDHGGRFLKNDRKCFGWVHVTDEMARLKVAHVFRSLRDRGTAKESNESIEDATTSTMRRGKQRSESIRETQIAYKRVKI